MALPDLFDDQEVADWIEAQPRQLTYSELAAACLRQFGEARAWDVTTIRVYWLVVHPHTSRSSIDRDRELAAFLRDRIGRLTGGEIMAQCEEAFGIDRVPSRTAFYKFQTRETRHLREARAVARQLRDAKKK